MAKKRQKLPDCLNCKTPLPEDYNFCPKCGQENDQKIKPITSYLDDSFHDWFAFDNRLWRSIIPFLFRPAYLTKAYSAGRRQDYVTPVRLYLTMSVLCFFVISLLVTATTNNSTSGNTKLSDLNKKEHQEDSIKRAKKRLEKAKKDSLANNNANKKDTTKTKKNSLNVSYSDDEGWSFFGEKHYIKDHAKAKKILESPNLTRKQKMDSLHIKNTFWNYTFTKQRVKFSQSTPNELLNYVLNKLPIVMFVLLPFFAWLLHLFYIFSPKKVYYIESLVFTLHTHSFVFFSFFIGLLITYFYMGVEKDDFFGVLWGWILLINMFYIFVAQKRFYGQGYIWTFIKYSIYSFLYVIVLSIGLVIGILLTMLFFY